MPHPPVNVVFKDGIFTIVPSNKKGNSTKDVEFKKPKTKQEQKSEKLIKACENIKNDEGTARVSDLAKIIGVSLNTVKTYIASTDGFKKVKDGYVTYSLAK